MSISKEFEGRINRVAAKSRTVGHEIAGQVYRLERDHLAAQINALCGHGPEPSDVEYSPAQQMYVDERERNRPRATPESRARKLCDLHQMITGEPGDYVETLAQVRADWNEAIHG
jgi:hypothetical protein